MYLRILGLILRNHAYSALYSINNLKIKMIKLWSNSSRNYRIVSWKTKSLLSKKIWYKSMWNARRSIKWMCSLRMYMGTLPRWSATFASKTALKNMITFTTVQSAVLICAPAAHFTRVILQYWSLRTWSPLYIVTLWLWFHLNLIEIGSAQVLGFLVSVCLLTGSRIKTKLYKASTAQNVI